MPKFIARNDPFVCEHCRKKVEPIKYGGSYRNHCPYCLWSKHVDSDMPGDRANSCQGLMEPVAVTTRRTGEFVLTHRCVKCGFERFNRIAGDDDFAKITELSTRH
ncbi:RNHCP domain-containing protein [Patescibacteria group bacterium]|nr:RNHCP domain-containing protein [Patescibacteria group bacterium]